MHGHLPEHGAVCAVEGIGRDRTDPWQQVLLGVLHVQHRRKKGCKSILSSKSHVGGVDVLDGQRQTERFEVSCDRIFQPRTHICEDLVATSLCILD